MSSYRRIDAVEKRLNRAAAATGNRKSWFPQFAPYKDDPASFVREVLGGTSATRWSDGTPYQAEIAADVAEHPRVAVISGHGIGKTTLIAWLVIWWLVTRRMSRVILVAPQFDRQVRAINFSEIRRWVRRSKVPLPLEVQAGRVVVEGHGAEWSAIGVPATEPDRIEGFHGDHVLLVMDETKGIPQATYDALMGMLSGHGDTRLVVCSTPGGIQGPFYRIITRGEELGWRVHHLSADDSSNVKPSWCAERAREWGVGSPLYETRVRGRFADAGEGVLFPLSMIEAAVNRELTEPTSEVTLGVDVARSVNGDANCVAVCRGGRLEALHLWREVDAMKTVARVAHLVVQHGPRRVRVDESGVGAGVVDRLRQLGHPVEGVAFGGGAADQSRFRNKRAEMFWALRDGMEQGKVSLPDDDELVADLSALRFEFDGPGRILLEGKDEVRKRLGRSPDRADAVALALGIGARQRGWPMRVVDVEI